MRLRALLFLPLVLGAGAACASIWGFEDGQPAEGAADGGPIVDTEVVPAEGAVGIVCVPKWPGEWQGPLVLAETAGAPAPAPPECPTGYAKPIDGHANGIRGSCACECGDPTGMTCSTPSVSVYSDETNCMNGTGACRTLPVKPACTAYPDAGCPASNTFAKVTVPAAPVGGSCAVKGSGVIQPASWGAAARVCTPPFPVGGKCPAEKVPTPQVGLPYQTNYCVAMTGTASCPSAYPKQRIYFTGVTDTRTCQCGCAAPSGASCPTLVQGMDHDDCSGAPKGVPTSACAAMTNTSGIFLAEAGAPAGGSCAPTSTLSGDLVPSNPVTICCRR